MRSILNKPHPFIFNSSSVVIPFIITFLVLFIFKPFGFSEFSVQKLVLWSLLNGVIASFCVWLAVKVLKLLFPAFTNEDKWTVGKEILLFFIVIHFIALAFFLLFLTIHSQVGVWVLLHKVYLRTILISVFPVIVLVLYEQYYHQKLKVKEALLLNKSLQKAGEQNISANDQPLKGHKIAIKAENQKVVLQIEKANVLYVRSEANYVEVFYLENNQIQKELVRNSLKSIELQLQDDLFFRCHKSYLINLNHVIKAEGNARNLSVIVAASSMKIPVSRSRSNELQERIQNR